MNTVHSYTQVRGRGREARSESDDILHCVYILKLIYQATLELLIA